MSSLDRWREIGPQLDFTASFWIGGGIGDCVHRYKDLAYFRVLRHLKELFPRLRVILQIVGDGAETTRQLFEMDPGIDQIFTAPERGFMFNHVYDFMQNDVGINKFEYARFHPVGYEPETVFRRAVNRVYAEMRFPRIRSITMDDFFQQLKLNINDLEHDLAEIPLSLRDTEEANVCLAPVSEKGIVGLHWFSKDPSRACVPGAVWVALVKALLGQGYQIIVFGAPGESNPNFSGQVWHKNSVDLIMAWEQIKSYTHVQGWFSSPSIRAKVAALRKCKYFVCIDGGMMHLAWLHAVPTLTLVERPPEGTPDYFGNVHGYHWAAAAGEPFARRLFCDHGCAGGLSVQPILNELSRLDGTAGKRVSKVWRDQANGME